jgi:hypothetical protein
VDRNVGGRDRLARAGIAGLALVVAAAAALAGRPALAAVALLAAAGAGFNAAVGWCGVNAALGIDTRE